MSDDHAALAAYRQFVATLVQSKAAVTLPSTVAPATAATPPVVVENIVNVPDNIGAVWTIEIPGLNGWPDRVVTVTRRK